MERNGFIGVALGFLLFFGGIAPVAATASSATIDLAAVTRTGILAVNGEASGDQTGVALATGDIDGDGITDLVMGAPTAGSGEQAQSGKVFVVFGAQNRKSLPSLDLATHPEGVLRIEGEQRSAQLGNSVAAGDINGDGWDDLIFGAYTASPEGRTNTGTVYILFGAPDLSSAGTVEIGTTSRPLVKIIGEMEYDSGDEFGISVTAGDLNNDGYSDVIIGAWNADPYQRANAGKTHVLFGAPGFPELRTIDMRQPPEGTLTILGSEAGDHSGFFSAAGDLNGDGCDDLAIGITYASPAGRDQAGEVDVVFGAKDLASRGGIDLRTRLPGTIRLNGADYEDFTGVKLSIGDLDGDGLGDLCICAHGADTPGGRNAGKAYVVFGSPTLAGDGDRELSSHGDRVLCILGESAENYLGPSAFGDFNHDGVTDLIVGANGAAPWGRYTAGKGYVVYGSSALRTMGEIDLRNDYPGVRRILGGASGGRLGYVCAAGDLDGDGIEEMVFGAHGSSPFGRNNAGSVYIIRDDAVAEETPLPLHHFTFTGDTGASATVLISASTPPTVGGAPIRAGDEIGVFTPGGLCAGVGDWDGKDLAITIWGENTEQNLDGFRNGDPLSFQIWMREENRVYPATPRFASAVAAYWSGAVIELASLSVGVSSVREETPMELILSPNYPNPFNSSTTIPFTLPLAGQVSLAVYSATGQKVRTLASGPLSAGTHSVVWDGKDEHGATVSSGVYISRLESGHVARMTRMLFLK